MKVGKIVSIEFDKFRVRLFNTTRVSTVSIKGRIYYFGNIGSYLRTTNSVGDVILCEVTAVIDYTKSDKIYSSYDLDSSRELVLRPIGVISKDKKFTLGVGIFPLIYNDVEIVTFDDLDIILSSNINEDIDGIHKNILLGYSKNLISYPINLSINRLFDIHTAVLGNSGSGKSNTIAHILQEVFRKENNFAVGAKIILFDVNGEYHRAFDKLSGLSPNIKTVFYKPNIGEDSLYTSFHLPYHLMNLDEWLGFLMASERTQKPFWDQVLQECFKFYRIIEDTDRDQYINYFKWKIRTFLSDILKQGDSDTSKMTSAKGILLKCKDVVNSVEGLDSLDDFLNQAMIACSVSYGSNEDKMASFLKNDEVDEKRALELDSKKLRYGEYFDYKFLSTAVEFVLMQEESKGNARIREFTSTMISRLDFFLHNAECDFMRSLDEETRNQDRDAYLKDTFEISDNNHDNQLIIIDTSEVGDDVLELLTSVVSRLILDYRKNKKGDDRRTNPVHLILDEAHRYIRNRNDYILKENIFERIAKEGRKYSLYLIVSSQRPSELSSTVLSQCGNYIVHRVQNEVDLKYIYSVLPYFSEDFLTKIKQCTPGDALVFGNCVPMPLLVKVVQANPSPNSENCEVDKEWFQSKSN